MPWPAQRSVASSGITEPRQRMTRLLKRRHSRRENRRRCSRLRFDLAQAVRSPPGDVAGFAAVDKPCDPSLRVAYEDASRSRLAGLEEYVHNLCAEMAL